MKDQYSGDVGDFGKFGLLRALANDIDGGPRFRLGVIWYLTPNDDRGDGKHVEYLSDAKQAEYRSCDAHVYDRLRTLVHQGRRSVGTIEEAEVLPPDTLFYRATVPAQRGERERWADRARRAMTGTDVVFVDPDNGLEGTSPTDQHALFSELALLCDESRTVVIYQQQGRMAGGRTVEIPRRLATVRARLPRADGAFGLRFARGSSRYFIVIPTSEQSAVLGGRAQALIDGCWSQQGHFDRVIYK